MTSLVGFGYLSIAEDTNESQTDTCERHWAACGEIEQHRSRRSDQYLTKVSVSAQRRDS